MQLDAPRRGQLVVKRLADQSVAEAQPPRATGNRREDARFYRLVEHVEELIAGEFAQPFEGIQRTPAR